MDRCVQFVPLYLLVSLLVEDGASQHFYLLRPIPSDTLPLLELREDPDPVLDPRDKDLNHTELTALLGDFDHRFLSVTPPEDKYTGNEDLEEVEEEEVKPGGAAMMPREIKMMDFDVQFGKKQKPSKKLKRRLQQWLWSYSFCPVRYSWTDLGVRFWPRYLRAGSCLGKRSCSVPEGMMCSPASSTQLTVLRWRCLHRRGG